MLSLYSCTFFYYALFNWVVIVIRTLLLVIPICKFVSPSLKVLKQRRTFNFRNLPLSILLLVIRVCMERLKTKQQITLIQDKLKENNTLCTHAPLGLTHTFFLRLKQSCPSNMGYFSKDPRLQDRSPSMTLRCCLR